MFTTNTTNKKNASVTGRTLYYFAKATMRHWPYFLLIVAIFLCVYVLVVYHIFKKLQKLNAETAGAQNRLSTVASLDRIVVLKNGEIVEDGVHSELIAAGGEYADQLAACGFLITFLLSQALSGTRKPSYIFQCVCSRPFSDSECV